MDRRRSFVCLVASLIVLVAAIGRANAQMCATGTTCVLTWQYDNHRSGQNLNESKLSNGLSLDGCSKKDRKQ